MHKELFNFALVLLFLYIKSFNVLTLRTPRFIIQKLVTPSVYRRIGGLEIILYIILVYILPPNRRLRNYMIFYSSVCFTAE